MHKVLLVGMLTLSLILGTVALAQNAPEVVIQSDDNTVDVHWQGDNFFTATANFGDEPYMKLHRWNGATGSSEFEMDFPPNTVFHWSADGQRVLASGRETLSMWETGTGAMMWEAPAPFVTYSIQWNPDETRFTLKNSGETTVYILDALTGAIATIEAPRDRVQTVQWSPDGQFILTGNTADTSIITIWDANSSDSVMETEFDGEIRRVDWIENRIVVQSTENARILDSESGEVLATLPPGEWNPGQTRLATLDRVIQVWDGITGAEIATFEPESKGILWQHLSWSPDGRTLVAHGEHGLTAFDTDTGSRLGAISDNWGLTPVFEWSPDGKLLAVQGEQTQLMIFDGTTGVLLHTLAESAPTAPVIGSHTVYWSPDSTRLTNFDGEHLLIWDAASGQVVYQLPILASFPIEGEAGLSDLAWHPDGDRLLVDYGSFYDGASEVQLWVVE